MRSLIAALVALSACAPTLMWRVRSRDRSTRVTVLERSGRQRVVVGDEVQREVDAVGLDGLALSEDGRTVVYPALHAGRWHLAVNGALGAAYDGIGAVALSRDGRRVAFAAQSMGRWRVVSDGVEHADHAAIMAGSLRWSPRGERLVYVARDGDQVRVVVDGTPQRRFDAVRSIRFGDKDRRVAYVAVSGDAERVVIDGGVSAASKRIGALETADEGAAVAWIAEGDEGAALMLDGAAIATGARTFAALRVSADGATVACLRVNASSVDAMVNGRVEGTYDDAVGETLSLSRDGAHLTFVAVVEGRRAVVRDGLAGPRFDAVPELVSSDDGRWAYVGVRGEARSVFVDGRRVRRERRWMGGIALASQTGRYAYFVQRDRGLAVRDDERERLVGAAFEDSLAFDASGRRWGCIGVARGGDSPSFAVEGGARRPMEREELGSLILGGRLDAEAVRSVVRAELARSLGAE